jgi:hypothetical protein
MKPKKIVLSDEQVEACKEYLDMATKEAKASRHGAVVAQVVKLHNGGGVMLVNFMTAEEMAAWGKISGHELSILTDLSGYQT